MIFGLVTVASFSYAVWANRELKRVTEIRNTMISEIRNLANKIRQNTEGTKNEGYADGIVSICSSMIEKHKLLPTEVGDISFYYYPFEMPPMLTQNGKEEIDDSAKMKKTLTGAIINPGKKYLVFGPYKRLPLAGRYIAAFSIKLNKVDETLDDSLDVLRLDVYDYNGGRITLGLRLIKLGDLKPFYQPIEVEFSYTDLKQTLEYRIKVIQPAIEVSCDHIRVVRKSQ